MTENTQNNTDSSTGKGTANNGSTTTAEGRATKTLFPTLEAAQASKPESDKQRIFEVLKDGRVLGYGWGNSVNEALVTAARQDGYTARVAEPKGAGPLTKERVAARLSEFTDEELAAMGLSRKKGRK
jgi:hypothetical protein